MPRSRGPPEVLLSQEHGPQGVLRAIEMRWLPAVSAVEGEPDGPGGRIGGQRDALIIGGHAHVAEPVGPPPPGQGRRLPGRRRAPPRQQGHALIPTQYARSPPPARPPRSPPPPPRPAPPPPTPPPPP